MGGTSVATVIPKPLTKVQGLIAEGEGPSEGAAVIALRSLIETREVHRKDMRRWDDVALALGPSDDEFSEALRQAHHSRAQIAMFTADAYVDENRMTFTQLARALGNKPPGKAGKVFGNAGELIADYFGTTFKDDTPPDREGAILVLTALSIQGGDRPTVWVMQHELRDAVKAVMCSRGAWSGPSAASSRPASSGKCMLE